MTEGCWIAHNSHKDNNLIQFGLNYPHYHNEIENSKGDLYIGVANYYFTIQAA